MMQLQKKCMDLENYKLEFFSETSIAPLFFQSQMQLLLGITTVSFRTKSLHGLIIAQKCVCAWWSWFFLFDVEMTKT